MVNSKEICKLCLKYTQDDELVTLDNEILEKLKFLQIDLVSTTNNAIFCGSVYLAHWYFYWSLLFPGFEKIVESYMVCESCEIALEHSSSLVASWLKLNDCNLSENKEATCSLEIMDDHHDDFWNSSAFEGSDDNSEVNFSITKEDQRDEVHLTNGCLLSWL